MDPRGRSDHTSPIMSTRAFIDREAQLCGNTSPRSTSSGSARRRNRSVRASGARRTGGEGRAELVAPGVDEDPAAAIRLVELLGEMRRDRARRASVQPRARSARPGRNRRYRRAERDVKTLRPRRLHPTRAAELGQHVAQQQRGVCEATSGIVVERIEIEHADVGIEQIGGTRDVHTCGVMQFWLASHNSPRSSVTTG